MCSPLRKSSPIITTAPLMSYYTGENRVKWAGTKAVTDLMAWLDEGNSKTFRDAVAAGEVYMTDSNLRTAFGFAYKVSDSITWTANSTPIILDTRRYPQDR